VFFVIEVVYVKIPDLKILNIVLYVVEYTEIVYDSFRAEARNVIKMKVFSI
jgi:hypothetical protein